MRKARKVYLLFAGLAGLAFKTSRSLAGCDGVRSAMAIGERRTLYGNASATHSGGLCLSPIGTTMYCLPPNR